MAALRNKLQSLLLQKAPTARVNGPPAPDAPYGNETRLPNTLSISFKGAMAPSLMKKVEHRLACSAGSACHATEEGQEMHASYVLQAMGVPKDYAFGTLRLSVGQHTTEAEILEAAELVSGALVSSNL
jgi:cysteine desulfurase